MNALLIRCYYVLYHNQSPFNLNHTPISYKIMEHYDSITHHRDTRNRLKSVDLFQRSKNTESKTAEYIARTDLHFKHPGGPKSIQRWNQSHQHHGVQEEWWDRSHHFPKTLSVYHNGLCLHETKWFQNGRIASHYCVQPHKGSVTATRTAYYPSGCTKFVQEWRDGQRHGTWSGWWASGSKMYEEEWFVGRLVKEQRWKYQKTDSLKDERKNRESDESEDTEEKLLRLFGDDTTKSKSDRKKIYLDYADGDLDDFDPDYDFDDDFLDPLADVADEWKLLSDSQPSPKGYALSSGFDRQTKESIDIGHEFSVRKDQSFFKATQRKEHKAVKDI